MASSPMPVKGGLLDHTAAWDSMRRLLERVSSLADRDTFLDECLDTVTDLLGADRGLITLAHEGGVSAVNARSGNRALTAREREEVSKTIIARALATGEPVVWDPLDEGDATESIADLGIAYALAAPLRTFAWRAGAAEGSGAPPSPRGVLYVDFRGRGRAPDLVRCEFFAAAAGLISTVLDQRCELATARERLRAAEARAADAPRGPGLDELLRPKSMAAVRAEIASCVNSDCSVLILGESGTGKTQLACALAEARGRGPVVRAVLGSSDDLNTITSELFGHEKGSYSGALARRVGLVEFADGGTLILDEVLNLPPHAQQLLLDFTQFGTYRPLGYEPREPKRARVRIIGATNGDLDRAMREGRFRQDLYFRLAEATIYLPALRERREDVPDLVESVLCRIDPSRRWRLSLALRRVLLSEQIAWPGNVRQLESVIRRARERALAADPAADTLTPQHLDARSLGLGSLPAPAPALVAGAVPLCARFEIEPDDVAGSWARLQRERAALEDLERQIVTLALARHGGVVARAARDLGLARTGLLSRMSTLGIADGEGAPPRSAARRR